MVAVDLILRFVCRNQTVNTRAPDVRCMKALNVPRCHCFSARCLGIVRKRVQKPRKSLIGFLFAHQIKECRQLVPEIMRTAKNAFLEKPVPLCYIREGRARRLEQLKESGMFAMNKLSA